MSSERDAAKGGRRRAPIAAALTLAALLPSSLLAPGCGRDDRPASAGPLVGVKIYEHPGPYGPLLDEWRGLGINAAFVSEALARNKEFRAAAGRSRLPLFVIFPVFQSPEAISEDPGLAAVTADGRPARDEWVEFVCPAREDFLGRRADEIRDLVAACDPYAVSLDFIRYFVFWEKVAPDRASESLPQTCFCPVCLSAFAKEMGVPVPEGPAATAGRAKWILGTHAEEWTEWKCRVVARAAERLARAARSVEPGVKVNIHAVPWRRDDFAGAVASVAGQDLARLAPFVDFVSPMCYHHMVRRAPGWVHEVVEDMAVRSGRPVLASTQVSQAYIEEDLTPGEFGAAVEEALRPPSIGVVLWSWDALAASPQKREVLRSLARARNGPR